MNAHKKSPAIAAPGQAPQEGTRINQQNTISNFTPAQTPQACEIQKVALWVAGHIGTGMNAEDMIVLRDHLFALAEQVEETEGALFSVAVAYTEGRGITMELLPVGGTA